MDEEQSGERTKESADEPPEKEETPNPLREPNKECENEEEGGTKR